MDAFGRELELLKCAPGMQLQNAVSLEHVLSQTLLDSSA